MASNYEHIYTKYSDPQKEARRFEYDRASGMETRPQKELFSKEQMQSWYNSDNCLNTPGEKTITEEVSISEAVALILKDCGVNS